MLDRLVTYGIQALLVFGALWLVYTLFPPLFLLIAALVALAGLVFLIRQAAFAIHRAFSREKL